MSLYSDDDLANMSKSQLEGLRETALRLSSNALAARVDLEFIRRWAQSAQRQGQPGDYFRRRGDWFVETWDGRRIPVLHSLRLGEGEIYRDDTARRVPPRGSKKDLELLALLEVTDVVVVQKDRGDGSDQNWHSDGYVGLFRILSRTIHPDGSFVLGLRCENNDIRPKMRSSAGS
jgi:hypothetical protein